MSLVRVELRRLTSRRLVRVVALIAMLGLFAVLVMTAIRSHAPGPAEHERAAAIVAQQQAMLDDQQQECRAAEEQARATDPAATFSCDDISTLQINDVLQDPRFRFAQAKTDMIVSGAMVLALLGFVAGAGFIGAEWSAGTLSNLLLFEPRRVRVLAAKAGALAAGVGALGVVFMIVEIGGLYAISATRGDLTGTTPGLLRSMALGGVRAVLLAIAAALVGYALAGASRHTAAALGIAFGYVLGGEVAIRAIWQGAAEPWLLSNHVLAWLQAGFDVHVTQCEPQPDGGIFCGPGPAIPLSTDRGALYLGVVLVAALAVFLLSFRRRDIA